MRSRALGAVGVVLGPFLAAGCSAQSSAECAGPVVGLSEEAVPAGESVTVTVEHAFTECFDTGEGLMPPAPEVGIILEASGQSFPLGTGVPDADGTATLKVVIPDDVPAGEATINVPDLLGIAFTTLTVTE
jgi:hypothetical protein